MRTTWLALGACAASGWAGAPPEGVPPRPAQVRGELAPLGYYLGDWTIEATWSWGTTLAARNEYRVGIGGVCVEVVTVASDAGGPPYERYHSFYTPVRSDGMYQATGFTNVGGVSTIPYTFEVRDGLPTIRTDSTNPDGSRLRQEIDPLNENEAAWRVWMTPPGSDQERQVMDGVWKRVREQGPATGAPATRPIDPALFDASGADLRSFVKTAEIEADAATVFRAWASAEGWSSVYDAQGMGAEIDLAIGGPYEWYFYDQVGSNGCQVLSYIPDRMISFTWNAPPNQPVTRERRTWVVVELEPVTASRTRVTLTHLGFGQGPEWDETYAYFDKAWPSVLGAMASKLKPAG